MADIAAVAALMQSAVPVLVTDPVGGTVVDANLAACSLFGLTLDELLAVDCLTLRDPKDHRWAHALVERARTGAFHGELCWRRGDGSAFPADVSCSVIKTEGGMLSAIVVRPRSDRSPARQPLADIADQARLVRHRMLANAAALQQVADELAAMLDPRAGEPYRRLAALAGELLAPGPLPLWPEAPGGSR